MTDIGNIHYEAEPTPALFHADDSFFRGIMGPFGSGKSVAMVWEIFMRARNQRAFKGVRRSRWIAVRNTYKELALTTLKTWKEWFPEPLCKYSGAAPVTAFMNMEIGDGTRMELEVIFLALDQPGDVKRLLSLECTGIWFNEAREIVWFIMDKATGRPGRYPPKWRGGSNWRGIIADTNPPPADDKHWWYRLAEIDKPDRYRFFKQPGALIKVTDDDGKVIRYDPNPLAENVRNQEFGYDYWYQMIPGKDEESINVYILGEYGAIFEGQPVYGSLWSDSFHASKKDLEIMRGRPILMGWDNTGLSPACCVGQLSPLGQMRILREYWADDLALREFCQMVVHPGLQNDFQGMAHSGWDDPASKARATVDEATAHGELQRLGFNVELAATNEFGIRRQAVATFLNRRIGDDPGFILDPSCERMRQGFNGGYQYRRMQVSGGERFTEKPEKNKFSHIHDALQYLCLGLDPATVRKAQGTGRPGVAQRSTWKGST